MIIATFIAAISRIFALVMLSISTKAPVFGLGYFGSSGLGYLPIVQPPFVTGDCSHAMVNATLVVILALVISN